MEAFENCSERPSSWVTTVTEPSLKLEEEVHSKLLMLLLPAIVSLLGSTIWY